LTTANQTPSRRGTLRNLASALIAASAQQKRSATARPAHSAPYADYALLKRTIKEHGLLARQPAYYTGKILFTFALVLAAVAWVAFTRHGALVFLGAPFFAFVSGQLVLLAHDAAHGMVFSSPRNNAILSILCINALSGGSHGWWTRSHNEHHARSNDRDHDPDINYPFFAFSEEQAAQKHPGFRIILERQHVLAFCLMSLVGLTLRIYSLAHLWRRGTWPEWLATLCFWVVYAVPLLCALGVGRGLLFFLVHQVLFGLYLGTITAVNHWAMPMPRDSHRLDFVRHQVITSRNVAGGWLVDLWFGGLNRQIEHHLFPTMPRNNLVKARPFVRRFCAERDLPYHEVGPAAAYGELFTTLRRVARHVRERRQVTAT
jgi:fatty acid desaturase